MSQYKWAGIERDIEPDAKSPMSNFESYILDRKRLIDEILSRIEIQKKRIHTLILYTCQSIYIHGGKGMGTASNFPLIAKSLQDLGYEVYYFSPVAAIPARAHFAFKRLVTESSTPVAVLVS